MSNAQYTPPTPTRLNCRVELRRRCVLGISVTALTQIARSPVMLWIRFIIASTHGHCAVFSAVARSSC